MQKMMRAYYHLEELGDDEPAILVIYFSGHSICYPDTNMLMAVMKDGQQTVNLKSFARKCARTQNTTVLAVLDCHCKMASEKIKDVILPSFKG